MSADVPNLKIDVLEHVEDVSRFWAWLTSHTDFVAVDTETTGLDWHAPDFRVRLVQFGDAEGGWAMRLDQWRGVVQAAFDWCSQHRVTMVWHNHTYDMNALWAEGIDVDWTMIGDTFALAGIMGYADEGRGLKAIGLRRYGRWATMGDTLLKKGMSHNGWTWADVPYGWLPYPLYAVVDTCLTAMVWRDSLPVERQWRFQHDLEIATGRIVSDMMRTGVTVDGTYLAGAIKEWQEKEDALAATLAQHGVVHPTRNDEIARVLMRDGVTLPKTDTGKWSTAKDALADVTHPVARAAVEYRLARRMRGTYLADLLERIGGVMDHGVLHPEIAPMEARTGRMSIARPPLQQIPRDDRTVRNAVVPRDESHVLVTADYGQIELRVWARIMGDEALGNVLREADRTGGDFFVEVGKDVYAEPDFVKSDPRRTLLKNVTYGTMYGAGLATMANSAKVSEEVMEPVATAMKERYPSFRTLGIDHVDQLASGWQFVTPVDKTFRVRSKDEARKLPNYAVQGTSAVILKQAMVNAAAAGLGEHMLLPVHDEILMSVPKDEAEDAGRALKESMEAAVYADESGIQITADPTVGNRWGSLK